GQGPALAETAGSGAALRPDRLRAADLGAESQAARIYPGRNPPDALRAGRTGGGRRTVHSAPPVPRPDQASGAAQARDRSGACRAAANVFLVLCPHGLQRWLTKT